MNQRSSLSSRICGTAALVLLTCGAARLHAAAPATAASRTDISAAACTPAEERGRTTEEQVRTTEDPARTAEEQLRTAEEQLRTAPSDDRSKRARHLARGPFAAHVLRQRRVHGDPLHDLPPRKFFRFAERRTGDHRGIQLDIAPGFGRRRRLFGRVHLGPARRFRTHQPHSLHRPRIRRAAARRTQVALPRKRGYRLRPLHPRLRRPDWQQGRRRHSRVGIGRSSC